MASRKKRFFYIILTAHYFKQSDGTFIQQLGYGVTDAPGGRVRKYSTTSGGEQEFVLLWFSPTYKVEVLEDLLKERVASKTHKIHSEYVEWINPAAGMTVELLSEQVEEIISELRLDVRRIKQEYLPFNDSDWQKEINHDDINRNMDKYLDPKRFDKKSIV